MTAPPVTQGLGSAETGWNYALGPGASTTPGVAEYITLAKQLQDAQTSLKGMTSGGIGGFGASPGFNDAQITINRLTQQMTPLREKILAAQPPAPDGYHWGIMPDGSLKPVQNAGIMDTLGPIMALAGPALGFIGASVLAPAAAGAGGSGAAATGTFGTAGMAGATGAGMAAPALVGAGGLAAATPAVAGGAAPVAGSTAAGFGGAGTAAGVAGGRSLLDKVIPAATTIASGVIAGSEQGKANDFTQQAIDLAKQDYAGRQPFRDQALAALRAPLPQQQDRTPLFANPSNPYAKYAAPQVMTGPLQAAPATAGGTTVGDALKGMAAANPALFAGATGGPTTVKAGLEGFAPANPGLFAGATAAPPTLKAGLEGMFAANPALAAAATSPAPTVKAGLTGFAAANPSLFAPAATVPPKPYGAPPLARSSAGYGAPAMVS